MKKRTKIADISPVGRHLKDEYLAAVIGGFACGPGGTETQATTLNGDGMPDTAPDCVY